MLLFILLIFTFCHPHLTYANSQAVEEAEVFTLEIDILPTAPPPESKLTQVMQLNRKPLTQEQQRLLLQYLDDEETTVLRAAIRASGSAQFRAAGEKLVSMLSDANFKEVWPEIIEALTKLNAAIYLPQIEQVALTADPRARLNALKAMVRLNSSDLLRYLVRGLYDRDRRVRIFAIENTEDEKSEEIFHHLFSQYLREPDREISMEILKRLKAQLQTVDIAARERQLAILRHLFQQHTQVAPMQKKIYVAKEFFKDFLTKG